jgi:hypothetical protein
MKSNSGIGSPDSPNHPAKTGRILKYHDSELWIPRTPFFDVEKQFV